MAKSDFDATPAVKAVDPQNKYVSIVEQVYQDYIPGSVASQAGSEVLAVIQNMIKDMKARVQEA
jgi:hypothetical protein